MYETKLHLHRVCNKNDPVPKAHTFSRWLPKKMRKAIGSPQEMLHIGHAVELDCSFHEFHEMDDYIENLKEYKQRMER